MEGYWRHATNDDLKSSWEDSIVNPLIGRLIEDWERMCREYDRQIALLRNGKIDMHSNGVDTTAETLERVRELRAELVRLIAKYRDG